MTTLAATITDTGIVAPDYADILAQLKNAYWSIFGSDAVLTDDSQDGQLLAVFALALYDANQMTIAVYNAYAPGTAQGVGLSQVVKINGIRRKVATRSTAPVTVVGVAGTAIANGQVGDNLGLNTRWDLPALVNVPDTGTIDVTATCTVDGAFTAAPGSLTEILTPTRGWQTVHNGESAAPGNPVETDAQLRQRQAASTALGADTILQSIFAAVDAIPGVSNLLIYENQGADADSNGIPSHSICVVVEGGDVVAVAGAIALKKPPGTGTFGDVSEVILDSRGVPNTVRLQPLTLVPLSVSVTISPGPGYTSAIGDELKAALVDYIKSFSIGQTSYLSRLYGPAGLSGVGSGTTYVVTTLLQSRRPTDPAAGNVVIEFDELATLDVDDITLITS